MFKNPNNQLIKILKTRPWMVQEFNALPFYILSTGGISGWLTKKFIGINYSHFIIYFNDKKAKFYYDEIDLANMGEAYFKKIKDLKTLKSWQEFYKKGYLASVKKTGEFDPNKLKNLPFNKLVALAISLTKEITAGAGIAHALEGIAFVSEARLKEILRKYNADTAENFQLLSSPSQISFLSQAQTALWEIKRANGAKQQNLIKKFISDFGWIENNYVAANALTGKEVLAKAIKQAHPANNNAKKTQTAKQDLIKKLKLTAQEKFVIQTIDYGAVWQDERKKFMLKAMGRTERVIQEISSRLGLNLDVFKFITPQEINLKNLSNKTFLKKLKVRHPRSVYYVLGGVGKTVSGEGLTTILSLIEKPSFQQAQELFGMVANKGFATGRVRVCQSLGDIHKVKKGEILVASMTRPEFLPAMQKAAGFVTDEGGITSHASIVSREMDKPCIIGTKLATKIFKTGDLVEVDANKGIVKKI